MSDPAHTSRHEAVGADSKAQAGVRQRKIVSVAQLAEIRQRYRDKTIVLCHGAFDLVHMGHLIHFEEARALGDLLVVTITGDQHITKKRSVSFHRGVRARARSRRSRSWTSSRSSTSRRRWRRSRRCIRTSTSRDPSTRISCSTRRRTSSTRRTSSSATAAALHFTSGETFSSTKLSHFLLASPEAAQDNPLLRNDRVLFRDVSGLHFTLEEVKSVPRRRERAARVPARRDDHRRVGRRHGPNISQKSRCVAGLETARVRQIGGAGIIALHLADFVKHVDCFTNGLGADDVPANVTVHSAGRKPARQDALRRSRERAFRSSRASSCRSRTSVGTRSPTSTTTTWCSSPTSAMGCSTPRRSTRASPPRRRRSSAAMAQVNSSNYGYNLPSKYAGARLLQREPHRSRAVPARAGPAARELLARRMAGAAQGRMRSR